MFCIKGVDVRHWFWRKDIVEMDNDEREIIVYNVIQ
jgi:hypothetical protein